jgi:hypothetical protein
MKLRELRILHSNTSQIYRPKAHHKYARGMRNLKTWGIEVLYIASLVSQENSLHWTTKMHMET